MKDKKEEVVENKNLLLFHCAVDEHYYHVFAESEFDATEYAVLKWQEEDGGKMKDGIFVKCWR